MKGHWFFFLICGIPLASPVFAQPSGEHFTALWQEAAQAYKDGKIPKAAELYQQALQEHPASWQAHYNTGNAHFRAGNYPDALEHYWRAFKINPRNPRIIRNLNLAAQKTGDAVAPPGVPAGLYLLWHILTTQEWKALTLIFWWLTALALLVIPRAANLTRPMVWTMATALAITLSISVSHIVADRRPWAILKIPGLLRAGPSENLPVTVQIPEGRFIRIRQQKDEWSLVETRKEKLNGWLR